MSGFSDPEYASYVALCRELLLEREFDDGDFYTAPVPISVIAPEGFEVLTWVYRFGLPNATEDCVWLPRLDQWISMLEEVGFREIRLWPTGRCQHGDCWRMDTADGPDKDRWLVSRPCDTREEAAARLWMLVAAGD